MTTPTAADIKRARAITLCSEKCDPQLCWLHETTEKIAQALADERERAAVVADAEAEAHRLRDDPQRMDAARWLASKIRSQR